MLLAFKIRMYYYLGCLFCYLSFKGKLANHIFFKPYQMAMKRSLDLDIKSKFWIRVINDRDEAANS